MNLIHLMIAGAFFAVSSRDKRIIELVKKRLHGYISSGGKPCLKIEVLAREDFIANPYEFGRPHQIYVKEIGDDIVVSSVSFSGWLNLRESRAEVSVPVSLSALLLYLRFAAIMVLSEKNGIVLHASSVAHDGCGHVFSGIPNSGKSTIAALSAEKRVLCDDFSIIRKIGNEFRVFPSPFWGRVNSGGRNEGGSYPMKGIYFIYQSDEHFLRSFKSRHVKLASLHQNILMFPTLKAHCRNLFALENELVDQVPFYKLYFAPHSSIWRCIDAQDDIEEK